MAKQSNTTPQNHTLARITRTEAYAAKVRAMFDATVNRILELNKSLPEMKDGEMYSFDAQSEKMRTEVERCLRQLHSVATAAIQQGIKLEWDTANAECDKLLQSQFGKSVLKNTEFSAWTKRNGDAMRAFIARSDAGMNLSERVWQTTRQLRDEMEVAITVAVGDGTSAQSLSRNVRKYLNDPDLMFRRFRYKDPETGEWRRKWKKRVIDPATGRVSFIDYDKSAYQDAFTGRGYYKSAAMNAMRVARTETNIAYRRADAERWSQMDFVLGQRVQMSRNHPKKDICDKLAGDYPKDFVFDGWHPQCFCYVTPINIDEDTMFEIMSHDNWQEELKRIADKQRVTDYPDNFKSWVTDNADNINAARERGTEPYFIRNNASVIDNILNPDAKPASTTKKMTPTQIAEQRHAERTPEQINETQTAWNRRRLTNMIDDIKDLDIYTDSSFNETLRLLEDDISLGEHKMFERDLTDAMRMIENARAIEYGNTEKLMNTALFKSNNAEIESAFGQRGTAMPFRPANELRGNPNYLRDRSYRENCQSCVVANELRRRGFPVESLGNTAGSALEKLSYHTESAWIDANGNIPTSTRIGAELIKKKSWSGREYTVIQKTVPNRKALVKELETKLSQDGRYHIKWDWKSNSGHIITVERVGGKFRYYDPQNGQIISDFTSYIDGIDLSHGISVLRVDNLRVNPNVAKNVLTKSASKPTTGNASNGGGITGKLRVIPESECNYTLPNGGRVTTPEERLSKGNYNKQEQAKFEKELRMAKQFANGGHKIDFAADDTGSYDVLIDGAKADFKSTSSAGNIVKYAKHAIREQGADIVLFEFTKWGTPFIEEIAKLKRLGIHGKYVISGNSTIYTF